MGEKPPLVKKLPATTTVTILPVSEKFSFSELSEAKKACTYLYRLES